MQQNIRKLSSNLLSKTVNELNENPSNIACELEELKLWIHNLTHLNARTDNQFLLTFLRACKHNIPKTKIKIEMFYTCRTGIPEIMNNRDPLDPHLKEVIRLGVGLPLPYTEHSDSARVVLIRPGCYDATKYDIADIMKVANMINDILIIEDDNIVISGEIAIVDFQNVTKSHLLQLDPLFVKKLALLHQEGSPIMQKAIHYVHTPPGFEVVFNLFKSIMQSKNTSDQQAEIFIHPTTSVSLSDHISRKVLPLEYGGESGSIESIIDSWEQKLINYRDYFVKDNVYGTNEELRPPQYQHQHADFLVARSSK